MTTLLEKAIAQVAKLPEKQQDALASLVMEEIETEQQWENAFENSQTELADLALEALSDHSHGRTKAFPA